MLCACDLLPNFDSDTSPSEEVMFCQLAAVFCSKDFHWISSYAH